MKGGKGKGKRGGKKGGKKGKKGKKMNADDLDYQLENYMGEDAVKSRLDNDLDFYFQKKQVALESASGNE